MKIDSYYCHLFCMFNNDEKSGVSTVDKVQSFHVAAWHCIGSRGHSSASHERLSVSFVYREADTGM